LIQFVFKKKAHKSIFKYKKGIKKKQKKMVKRTLVKRTWVKPMRLALIKKPRLA
jgi:hypothetical protein